MSKSSWWMFPLVVVIPILAILNVVLFALLPIQSEELLLAQGLYLNICGAVITLAPDVVGLDKLFEPTERVERIVGAQNELFLNGSLKQEHGEQAYSKLANILSDGQDFPTPPDKIAAMSGGYGVSASVYFQYELGKEDIGEDDPNDWQKHKNERIGPTGVMDSRVSEYIEELKSRGHQLGFALGIVLLLVGFVFQFAATVY